MNDYPIKAKKSLGQNFLIDTEALSDIANSIETSGKHIIEVGPGYGALTDYLIAQNPKSLDLVELDGDMIELLLKRCNEEWWLESWWKARNEETEGDKLFESESEQGERWALASEFLSPSEPSATIQLWKAGNLCVYKIDILKFQPKYSQYSVIANIPYYITSPILIHFLYDLPNAPREMVILMQKEVGEKILKWRARKPHHSFISLAMEEACEDIEIVRYVWRMSFDPAPKVDSIVLKFTVKMDRNRDEEDNLIRLWKVAFAHPRKTLLSNLKWSYYDIKAIKNTIAKLWYDSLVRAEAVKREDWKMFLSM